jgi:acyl carrier protein
MVPSRVVAVDAIPLTANGKADARALLARGGEDRKPTSAAPRNSDEEALVAIWCEVLKVDRLGVHDNFFELGGHSLLAMQIISRIRSRFGVQLPVQSFLLGPTIAEVAANIRQCSSAAREDEEIDRILGELDAMSEEEAAEFLAAQLASPHHRA